MSIWDAFSGVPGPRINTPKSCACCGKFHGLNSEVKKDDTKKAAKSSHSTSEKENYSEADNAVIVDMKNGGSSWKEILKATGKSSESQLKEHYKEHLKDKSSATSQPEANNKKGGDTTKGKKIGKAGNVADTADSKKGGGKQGDKQQEDNLKVWADNYDQKKWLAVASKHFDKTGQRITAEMARKMAEGK